MATKKPEEPATDTAPEELASAPTEEPATDTVAVREPQWTHATDTATGVVTAKLQ